MREIPPRALPPISAQLDGRHSALRNGVLSHAAGPNRDREKPDEHTTSCRRGRSAQPLVDAVDPGPVKKRRARVEAEPTASPARLAVLKEAAVAAGASWAKHRRDALIHEGRLAVGGWPGTMSEARGFAASYLSAQRRAIPGLTREELSWLARATYAHARRDWLAWQNE
jgi:hypothetical protein